MKNKFLVFALLPMLAACNKGGAKDYSNFILGLGADGVPVGTYSRQILAHFGINEAKLNANGHVSYGQDVAEVANQVKQAMVGAGMIYKTDAFTHGLKVVDHATSEMCNQVLYPAAVMHNSSKKQAASSFLSYLRTQAAMNRFEGVGFTGLNKLEEPTPQVTSAITLNVYAARSLNASLDQVISDYQSVASNVTVIANYAGSGALKTQIINGGDCDLFISADEATMDALEAAGEYVEEGTRINILENQVVLAVPSNNPYKVNSYSKLISILDKLDN